MKKIFNAPQLNIVRFDAKDVIATSEQLRMGDAASNGMTSDVQERRSIWD